MGIQWLQGHFSSKHWSTTIFTLIHLPIWWMSLFSLLYSALCECLFVLSRERICIIGKTLKFDLNLLVCYIWMCITLAYCITTSNYMLPLLFFHQRAYRMMASVWWIISGNQFTFNDRDPSAKIRTAAKTVKSLTTTV